MADQSRRSRMKVTTRFERPDGGESKVRHAGFCEITEENGLQFVWQETQEGETIRFTLWTDGSSARMLREGSASGTLTFVPGKRTQVCYETPYGVLDMGLQTHALALEKNGQGGSLKLHYDLMAGEQKDSTAHLELLWRA